MKNFIILLCFMGQGFASLCQNIVQVEYYIDADGGFGNNFLVNVTPETDGTFPFTVNLAGVVPGYHKLYIRTKDSDGKWSITARRNIEVLATAAKTTIVGGEYFIDIDPGFGSGIPISVATPDSIILQNFDAVTTGLSQGYHKLYGRFKDNEGRWGLTFRRNIEIYKSDTNYVMKAEYFFASDLGFGNCPSITFANPSVDGSYSFNIPLSQIPAGGDTLFIRVQDSSQNKWSITQLRNIAVALPLTLLDFTATKQNAQVNLNWQTSNEVNTAYFNIQRSTDGVSFMTVGRTNAKSSSTQNSYSYIDDIKNLAVDKIYYRLQMIDKDGRITLSQTKMVVGDKEFNVVIHPNPIVADILSVSVYNTKPQILVKIFDMHGALVFSQQYATYSGKIDKAINVNNLTAGTYMLLVSDGTYSQTLKVVKQ